MNINKLSITFIGIGLVSLAVGTYLYSLESDDGKENIPSYVDEINIEVIDKDESINKKEKEPHQYEIDDTLEYSTANNDITLDYVEYDDEQNKLIFKNLNNNTTIGEYKCKTEKKGSNYCNIAYAITTDNKYNLEEKINNDLAVSQIIDNRYVLLKESAIDDKKGYSYSEKNPIILYDIKNEQIIETYTGVKDNSDYEHGKIIVKNKENLWGVISIKDGSVSKLLELEFDYIGYLNNIYVMVKDNLYYSYDESQNIIRGPFYNEITNVNDKFIVTNEGDYSSNSEKNYRLYSATGTKINASNGNKYVQLTNNFAFVINSENKLIVYDSDGQIFVNEDITIISLDKYHDREESIFFAFSAHESDNTLIIQTYSKDGSIIDNYEYSFN